VSGRGVDLLDFLFDRLVVNVTLRAVPRRWN
jgi:hypothetical protein